MKNQHLEKNLKLRLVKYLLFCSLSLLMIQGTYEVNHAVKISCAAAFLKLSFVVYWEKKMKNNQELIFFLLLAVKRTCLHFSCLDKTKFLVIFNTFHII